MKTSAFLSFSRLSPVLVLAIGSLGLTQISEAKPDDHRSGRDHRSKHSHSSRNDYRGPSRNDYRGPSRSDYHSHDRDYRSDRYRSDYMGRSRSSFTLSFGNGYAGQGYYYGPPQTSYYYQRPGVSYYRTRAAVPQVYLSSPGYYASPGYVTSDAARCQAALSRRGYYSGPIDGNIGPGSRAAIRSYQLRNGLTVTGYVDRGLLISLGLR
ncbi:MAG: peptidoglycan-binding domain-containing protein [Verrucomicrobiota bacterium]